MRIPSGSSNRYVYFVAVDATDLKTRETGLATWTVYRSRNGGASAAMTTPTINETDATNLPGVYELLLDEDTTLDSGYDTQEMVLHITHSGMAPVTRVVEIYRPKITEGETVTASDITAIKAKTDNLPADPADASDIAAAFAALNDLDSTAVQTAAAAALTAYDPPTKTELDSGLAALNDLDSTAVQTAAAAALTAYDPPTKTEMDTAFTEVKGATWSSSTDTLEALRDRGDAAWVTATGFSTLDSTAVQTAAAAALTAYDPPTKAEMDTAIAAINTGSGSGAYSLTVTVTDGTDPLESATVRLVEGANNFTASTNALGEASFSLDAATYTVTVTKFGYSFTPTTRTVTGNETGTLVNDLEMTAMVIAAASTAARTVTFQSVLYGVARRKGLDPTTLLPPGEARTLTEYINAAYQFCWRHYQWPESVTVETATATSSVIAWSGATTYRLGDVLAVTKNHPITDLNPTPIPYEMGPAGLYLKDSDYADAEVYVTYRREAPQFTATTYSSATAYAVDEVMYFTDGDCYKCVSATTAGQTPVTHAAKWEKQDLLALLAEPVKQAALAEALREDGQHSTSLITDGVLAGLLDHEIDRLTLDQGQVQNYAFSPR